MRAYVRRLYAACLVLLLVTVVGGAASGCGDRRDDGTAPAAAGALPPLTFGDDTPNLMLTWIDPRGATHVEVTPSDVPPEARSFVRVLVADREEGTRDPIYVADLKERGEGGVYEARTLARSAWEREIEERRAAWMAEAAPPVALPGQGPAAPLPPGVAPAPRAPGSAKNPLPDGVVVVIYGAAWCKPCHQAADWLKERGVPTVVKDVETMPGAHAEMTQKLEKAGRRGSSIPVIDVAGQILVGFNARALEKALAGASGGTML